MVNITKLECLKTLINHEIGELRRLKKELNLAEHIPALDNFSILALYSPYLETTHIQEIGLSMRLSDVLVHIEKLVLCLLPGTDKEGAIHLAEGIREFLGEEGHYAVVTYPEDGESFDELIQSLKTYFSSKGKTLPIH